MCAVSSRAADQNRCFVRTAPGHFFTSSECRRPCRWPPGPGRTGCAMLNTFAPGEVDRFFLKQPRNQNLPSCGAAQASIKRTANSGAGDVAGWWSSVPLSMTSKEFVSRRTFETKMGWSLLALSSAGHQHLPVCLGQVKTPAPVRESLQ